MNGKVKNILRNIGFLLSIPVIIGAFVFARQQDLSEVCKGVNVHISNPEIGFVNAKQLTEVVLDEGVILNETKLNELDIQKIEEKIRNNPWIHKAELFIDANDQINVQVEQEDVLVRVQRLDSSVNGYFLNKDAEIIPLSNQYFPYLPVITTKSSLGSMKSKKDLIKMASFIYADSFWNATISQINYDKSGEIQLISAIGDAAIQFGSIDDMEDKFERLFQFYKKGISRINWQNVQELDVRFKKQLVCRRFHKEALVEEIKAPIMYAKRKSDPIKISQTPKFLPAKKKSIENNKTVKKDKPKEPSQVSNNASNKNEATTEEKKKSTPVKTEAPVKKEEKTKSIIIETEPVTLKN